MKFFMYFHLEKSFSSIYLVDTKGHRGHFWLLDIKYIYIPEEPSQKLLGWKEGEYSELNFSSALPRILAFAFIPTFSVLQPSFFFVTIVFWLFQHFVSIQKKKNISEFLVRYILQNPKARDKLSVLMCFVEVKTPMQVLRFVCRTRLLLFVWQIRQQAHKLCCEPVIKTSHVSFLDFGFSALSGSVLK